MSRLAGRACVALVLIVLTAPAASAGHDPHTRERWCGAGEVGCTVGRHYDGFAASALRDPFGTQLQNWLCGGNLQLACTLAEKVDAGTYALMDTVHVAPSEYARFGGLAAGFAYARASEVGAFACGAGGACVPLP